jgi:hypothetical protein
MGGVLSPLRYLRDGQHPPARYQFRGRPKVYWAFWPLFGWGIGLLAHGLATYRWMPFIGKEWEERKIRELMDKDRRDASPR